MTTTDAFAKNPEPVDRFRLPDPPEHPGDKMTNAKHLSATGNHHHLAKHLGSPDTTIVAAERYVVIRPTRNMAGSHYPDLLVAFDVDPDLYEASNGYIISEQGKPPDFVLEIASRHTGRIDVGEKRVAYAAAGILEYWRFDETGQYHRARLAGDRLVDGRYVPIDIRELPDGSLEGYSTVLNLYLRWENGQLSWYDPATGQHILTYEDQRRMAEAERESRMQHEARAARERQARVQAENRADAAEAQVRQLQEELQRLRGA